MTFPIAFKRPRTAGLLRLAALVAVLSVLAGGGYLWLRNSSLVAVTDVTVTGATSSQAAGVRQALTGAARSMTTLNVSTSALKDAVAPYSSVGSLSVKADFPHKLTIAVDERRPVAAFADGSARVPLTGDGIVLRGVVADRDLPTIELAHPIAGRHVSDGRILSALAVARTAPDRLLAVTRQLSVGANGVTAQMQDGPDLVFGSGAEAAAKWAAAARVLAEPSAAGATYLDLRVPGRVAAGGLAPVPQATPTPNPQLQGQNGQTVNP
jgi:cell division protein FtsQ